MNDILNRGIVGIVTGVITTSLMFFVRSFWQSKVIPFLRELRYQGVQIDGVWVMETRDEEHESESRLVLKQSAQELSGVFTFKFRNKEKDFILDFSATGHLWEGYLTLNFIPVDKRKTSYATALLKIDGGGVALTGYMCFRNVEEETVTPLPMAVVRAESQTSLSPTHPPKA